MGNDDQLQTMNTMECEQDDIEELYDTKHHSAISGQDMIGSDSLSENEEEINKEKHNETMLGIGPNEMVQFKQNIKLPKNMDNDIIPAQNGAITMIGMGLNEKVVFKQYDNDNKENVDIDGDKIYSEKRNNAETMMGNNPNQTVRFKVNGGDNIDEIEDKEEDIMNGPNGNRVETILGAMEENEQIKFIKIGKKNKEKENENEYKEEGKKEKNSVLTDLQNIKNQIVNALPDPFIEYEHSSHPINQKKGLYKYADDLSLMYDKSDAMKKSMDNTYKKQKGNKKKKKIEKNVKRRNSDDREHSKSNKIKSTKKKSKSMSIKDWEPGSIQNKSPSKSKGNVKMKSTEKTNVKNLDNTSKKFASKTKDRWKSFFARNGL